MKEIRMPRSIVYGFFAAALGVAAPLLAGPASAAKASANPPSVYTNPAYGMKMNVPGFAAIEKGKSGRILQFNSPPVERVINTVEVTVEESKLTAREVRARRKKRQEENKNAQVKELKVSEHRQAGRNTITFETEETAQGRTIRRKTLYVFDTVRTYRVDCIGTDKAFEMYGKEFDKCLDSFSLSPNGAAAGVSGYRNHTYGFGIQAPKFRDANPRETVSLAVFRSPDQTAQVSVEVQKTTVTPMIYRMVDIRNLRLAGHGRIKVNDLQGPTGRKNVPSLVVDSEFTVRQVGTFRQMMLVVFDIDRLLTVRCVAPSNTFQEHWPAFLACFRSLELSDMPGTGKGN